MRKDLRDVTAEDLAGFDAVIHLAALSNDPIGNLNDDWTADINYRASLRLASWPAAPGVQRFLFSSSCIMYGLSAAAVATEESPLDPQTEYARSKVRTELALRELADDGFSPVYLRNGTVYGLSPRMRFDTVLNDLVGQALTSGRIEILSDGTPWRPTVHVLDVARAFEAVLDAPRERIHNAGLQHGRRCTQSAGDRSRAPGRRRGARHGARGARQPERRPANLPGVVRQVRADVSRLSSSCSTRRPAHGGSSMTCRASG